MEDVDIFNGSFSEVDFTKDPLKKGTYEQCIFSNCNFSHTNLEKLKFVDCSFDICDLSMASVQRSIFNQVSFKNCKMIGLRFENCNELLFSAHFEHSILDYSSFTNINLTNSSFNHCQLHEVDFSGADMSQLVLEHCCLQRATFLQSNLSKTDFRSAKHYQLNPGKNMVVGAKFSLPGVLSLLSDYKLHIEH